VLEVQTNDKQEKKEEGICLGAHHQPDWLKHFEMWSGDKLGLPVFFIRITTSISATVLLLSVQALLAEFIIWIEREKIETVTPMAAEQWWFVERPWQEIRRLLGK